VNPYRFDMTKFPLVVLETVGDIPPDQLDTHFAEYRRILDRNQPYTLVYDATKIGKVDALLRKRYAEFMKTNERDFERLCLGCSFVITSAVVRGALTAVLWLTGSLPFPHKISSTREEAEAWAREQLRAGKPK
jgi:hypothetical protein